VAAGGGVKMSPTTPGSAWEKAYCESFNSRFRDNFQNLKELASELEAKVLSAEWKSAHRMWRPNSALDGLTSAKFATSWQTPRRERDSSSESTQNGCENKPDFRESLVKKGGEACME